MSAPAFRAITTRYKGYNFRSRLEARWAVFFDHLGIRWDYEPEGFELGNGLRYLPDFWLPDWDMWVEVKPGEADDTALEKASRLVSYGEKPVYITYGLPDRAGTLVYPDNNYWPVQLPAFAYFDSSSRIVLSFPEWIDDHLEHRCKKISMHQLPFDSRSANRTAKMQGAAGAALEAARGARFEFGQEGA
jgi:hypothetical protein